MTTFGSFVHLNLRMPASVFMDYVPIGARIWPSDLIRRGEAVNAGARRDFLGEWWSLQSGINSALDEGRGRKLSLFYDDAKDAFKRGEEELRNGKGPAVARFDFLKSAVLFACAGERGIFLMRALSEAASANADQPMQPAAAAILYEEVFRLSHRPNDAASAAAYWLESVKQDRDESTLGFRAARGLSLAAQGSSEEISRELLSICASLP